MTPEQRAALEKAADEYVRSVPADKINEHESFIVGAEYWEANQWIPVTERLPDERSIFVRVTFDTGNIGVASCSPTSGDWHDIFLSPVNVIAWLPDPLPYSPPKTTDNEFV